MIQNQNQWYVEVNTQSYGPYSVAQMIGFIGEGRIIASSLISQDPNQGFAMAVGFPAFAGQLAPYASPQILQQAHQQHTNAAAPFAEPQPIQPQTLQPEPIVQHPAQPQPMQAQIEQLTAHAIAPSAAATVFLVMAEISSENGMQFLRVLQAHGTAQRIGEAVWLLRGAGDIDELRNVLANTLTRQDRLFIMDSFNNRTAWFNIGADMDVRIKELWASIQA